MRYDFCISSDGKLYVWDAELMQYTGLKDKNGKEIYEGDILEWFNDLTGSTHRGVVRFTQGGFYCGDYYLYAIKCYLPVIIGNIYENPELLEEVEI